MLIMVTSSQRNFIKPFVILFSYLVNYQTKKIQPHVIKQRVLCHIQITDNKETFHMLHLTQALSSIKRRAYTGYEKENGAINFNYFTWI